VISKRGAEIFYNDTGQHASVHHLCGNYAWGFGLTVRGTGCEEYTPSFGTEINQHDVVVGAR
jgi:hypothetical protein